MLKDYLKNDYETFYNLVGFVLGILILAFCIFFVMMGKAISSKLFIILLFGVYFFFWSGIKFGLRYFKIRNTLRNGKIDTAIIKDFQVIRNDQALITFTFQQREIKYMLKIKKKNIDYLKQAFVKNNELKIVHTDRVFLPVLYYTPGS